MAVKIGLFLLNLLFMIIYCCLVFAFVNGLEANIKVNICVPMFNKSSFFPEINRNGINE